MALRTVGVRLQAEVSGYTARLQQAGRATRDFASELDKAARAGRLDAVADQAGRVGLALVGVAGYAVGMAARFDAAMSSVQAATHASSTELEMLRQAAIEAGKDTAYSATEAAQAIGELAKAGVSIADILSGGLSGALSLAAAGQMDVAEAAEVAASALTQFRLRGSDVGHVADLLAAGAGKAQGSVHDMSMALNQAGLVSAQMGLSIEDTIGTLTAFAAAGMMGSDAGTSLKTALLMLANPTKESKRLMDALGISAYDAQGNFVGITALAGQLQTQLGRLTQEQRNAAMAQIFGSDAIRAASILYEQGAEGIREWIEAVDDSGYAAETARLKTDNLIGDLERLRGEVETLAIQSGSGANAGLRLLVQALEAVVSQIGSLPPVAGQAIAILAGLTGTTLLLGTAWVKARRANAQFLEELRETGPAGQRAARGLELASRWAGRAAAAFAAFQIAGAILNKLQGELNPQIEALAHGLAEWGKSGRLAGESARVLGEDMRDLAVGLKFLADTDNSRRQWARRLQDSLESLIPGLDGTNTSLTRTRERVEAMDQALAGLVQSGRADEAAEAFDRLAEAAAKDGVSIDELRKLFPAYAGALEVAGKASGRAAGQVAEIGDAAGRSAEDIEALAKAFDALFDKFMSLDRALVRYKQGLVELREELTSGKRTLDINTQAGRDNVSAILDQIEVIDNLRKARIKQGESIESANAKYEKEIAGLRATAVQLGYNAAAVDELVGKYEEIPEAASTEVTAPGSTTAKKQVETFNFAIMQLPSGRVITIKAETRKAMEDAIKLREYLKKIPDEVINVALRVTGTRSVSAAAAAIQKQYANRWGGVYEHAQDGLLREAHIAPPTGPARYAYAEPATGGEAFIPRFGDLERSRRIWAYVGARWLGMLPTSPTPTASTAPAPPVVDVRVYLGETELRDMVRVEVAERDRQTARRVLAGARR